MSPNKVDVAIIGYGIGGSTLAAVLARQGLAVIVFEGGAHPRFTIGESMILETSEAMRALAEFYDAPELARRACADQLRYAKPAIAWRRRTRARLAQQTQPKHVRR